MTFNDGAVKNNSGVVSIFQDSKKKADDIISNVKKAFVDEPKDEKPEVVLTEEKKSDSDIQSDDPAVKTPTNETDLVKSSGVKKSAETSDSAKSAVVEPKPKIIEDTEDLAEESNEDLTNVDGTILKGDESEKNSASKLINTSLFFIVLSFLHSFV